MNQIIKSRIDLIFQYPFFGVIALKLAIRSAPERVQTMGTDGVELVYNPEWVDTLTQSQLTGVVAHEVMHVVLGHHLRRQGRGLGGWNIACDYALNPLLVDAGFALPAGMCADPRYTGMSAEEIYAILPENPRQQRGPGDVFDSPSGEPLHQQEAELKTMLAQAAQAARMQGKLPTSIERMVEQILAPVISWREVLQRFVAQVARDDYAWKRPSQRYFSRGVIIPGLYSEQLPPIVITVDTSGSIDKDLLDQFAAEIDDIMRHYNTEIHIWYCDAAIQQKEVFTPGTGAVRISPKGGGGTDFAPVMEELESLYFTPACLIYFTDLECGSFGGPPNFPVLWATPASINSAQPPFGEVVVLK